MERRKFFMAAVALVLCKPCHANEPLSPIHVLLRGRFLRTRMMNLKPGDVFIMNRDTTVLFKADSHPFINEDGMAQITAEVPDG